MNKNHVNTLAVIASLGGFLFGYDTAVISGTIGFVTDQYGLNTVMEGWYVSSALAGTLLGVLVAGVLSDRFGRKEILILSAVFFGSSAIGCMLATSFTILVVFRLLGGVGIGIASMLSPLYISEIAPAHKRGRLVSLYQFAITIGILFAYFGNAWFLDLAVSGENGYAVPIVHKVLVGEVWRIMLGSEALPALLFLILLLRIPKSPRWLASNGREAEAITVLSKIVGEVEAKKEVDDIKTNLAKESGGIAMAFKGGFKTAMIMGIALALLTQLSGINAIIYYGPRILEEAGLQLSDALGGQVIIGVVNVLFTLIAIWKIDSLGRKKLLLIGVSGIIISLIAVGLLFFFQVNNTYLLMGAILSFIACFAFSYGPVIWVLLSEIYPTKIRGVAMSLATFSLWIGTTFVGQMTPWFLENLKAHGTFWFFALCTLPTLYIIIKVMPETKGKTLEEIEKYWINK